MHEEHEDHKEHEDHEEEEEDKLMRSSGYNYNRIKKKRDKVTQKADKVKVLVPVGPV